MDWERTGATVVSLAGEMSCQWGGLVIVAGLFRPSTGASPAPRALRTSVNAFTNPTDVSSARHQIRDDEARTTVLASADSCAASGARGSGGRTIYSSCPDPPTRPKRRRFPALWGARLAPLLAYVELAKAKKRGIAGPC